MVKRLHLSTGKHLRLLGVINIINLDTETVNGDQTKHPKYSMSMHDPLTSIIHIILYGTPRHCDSDNVIMVNSIYLD